MVSVIWFFSGFFLSTSFQYLFGSIIVIIIIFLKIILKNSFAILIWINNNDYYDFLLIFSIILKYQFCHINSDWLIGSQPNGLSNLIFFWFFLSTSFQYLFGSIIVIIIIFLKIILKNSFAILIWINNNDYYDFLLIFSIILKYQFCNINLDK